jgi:hypothetical protein
MKLILGLAVLGIVLAGFMRSFWKAPAIQKDQAPENTYASSGSDGFHGG